MDRWCFCGGIYVLGSCPEPHCPRKHLGQGSWHVALPKLLALSEETLAIRYQSLDIIGLTRHVSECERRIAERRQHKAGRAGYWSTTHDRRQVEQKVVILPVANKQLRQDSRRVWRATTNQQQPEEASSSSGGNPVKLEPVSEGETVGPASDVESSDSVPYTVLDSDHSDASIFGLRSMLHDVDECDELSEGSSNADDPRSLAHRDQVARWRTEESMQDDQDFAYVFIDFDEAYANAGQAVAVAWSRARTLAEPHLVTDMAKITALEATSTKIRRVDDQKKARALINRKRKLINPASLRKPGRGTELEEDDEHKKRFIDPLAQLMMDCKVGHSANTSASEEEMLISLKRRATRVVATAEIPTLQRAVTTSDELRAHLDGRTAYMGLDNIEPMVMEKFLFDSRSQVRAVNAISWLCNNLDLGWPFSRIEKPNTKKAPEIQIPWARSVKIDGGGRT